MASPDGFAEAVVDAVEGIFGMLEATGTDAATVDEELPVDDLTGLSMTDNMHLHHFLYV